MKGIGFNLGQACHESDALVLSLKQKVFVEHYLVHFNAAKAAREAGYSKRGADVQGCRLLGNVKVQQFLQQCIAERAARFEITQDRIISMLASIAFVDHPAAVDYERGGRGPKAHDRLKALHLLGLHLGMWSGGSGDRSQCEASEWRAFFDRLKEVARSAKLEFRDNR